MVHLVSNFSVTCVRASSLSSQYSPKNSLRVPLCPNFFPLHIGFSFLRSLFSGGEENGRRVEYWMDGIGRKSSLTQYLLFFTAAAVAANCRNLFFWCCLLSRPLLLFSLSSIESSDRCSTKSTSNLYHTLYLPSHRREGRRGAPFPVSYHTPLWSDPIHPPTVSIAGPRRTPETMGNLEVDEVPYDGKNFG